MRLKATWQLTDNKLHQLSEEAEGRAHKLIKKTAFTIEANAKKPMMGAHTGRIYRIGSVSHQASAPGEAPAVDTSTLINSIGTKMLEKLKAIVYAGAEYALHLEMGTRYIAPRPFMIPAVEQVRKSFYRAMKEIVD